MGNNVIEVRDISKAYLIGLKETRNETLGGALFSWLRAPVKNYNILKRLNTFSYNDETDDLFWALKNISFDLARGETLGIIGKNGAGKSTMLKILSQVTNPTKGYADVYGRVSSLLEVGTGFNSELTGRENVYLNGTILGMTKKEIDKKFDEIVAFSGIEKFIDTQIKKYSNGMRIRLAFSVAAHIDTDVMIIDEVLSVGDAEFQKKSLAKMSEVAREGTAVILVTHNMNPIQLLCTRAIYLRKGELIMDGKTDDVIANYLGQIIKDRTSREWKLEDAPSSGTVKIIRAEVRSFNSDTHLIRPRDAFEFEFVFFMLQKEEIDVDVIFHLNDEFDNIVFVGSSSMTNYQYKASNGYMKAVCRVPEDIMNAGKFSITKLFVVKEDNTVLYSHNDDLLTFEITNAINDKTGNYGKIDGIIKPKLEWEIFTGEEVIS